MTALAHDALLPRHDSRLGLGATLALLAHAGLIGALALGLNWRLPAQDAVLSAELWAAVPQVAAPAPAMQVPPPPIPAPAPAPAPTPAPPPERRAEPPPPSAAEREAEIALEKAAQRKKDLQAQAEALHLKQKLDDKRLAEEKAAQRKKDLQAKELKAREEKARNDRDTAEKAREDKRQQELVAQREALEKARETKTQEAQIARQREENLKRMMGQAGATGTGAANAAGTAARDAAPSAAYAGRIKARIKPNIVLMVDVGGNPTTEVEVKCAPDGSIVGRRVVKPSGHAAWDETVLRAIDRTGSLPRDIDGRIPPTMILVFPRQES